MKTWGLGQGKLKNSWSYSDAVRQSELDPIFQDWKEPMVDPSAPSPAADSDPSLLLTIVQKNIFIIILSFFLNNLILCWHCWNIQYYDIYKKNILRYFFQFSSVKENSKETFHTKFCRNHQKVFQPIWSTRFFHWNERNILSFKII